MTSCDMIWLTMKVLYWIALGIVALFCAFQVGRCYERSRP